MGLTASAERQLLAALRTIADERPAAAADLLERIERALAQVGKYPESGRRLPEFAESPYREVLVAPYRLFYRRTDAMVIVVAIWHQAQQPRRPGEDG